MTIELVVLGDLCKHLEEQNIKEHCHGDFTYTQDYLTSKVPDPIEYLSFFRRKGVRCDCLISKERLLSSPLIY